MKKIIGVDEAGRGAWAGPVVAAAVCLKDCPQLKSELKDSKKLSSKQRNNLYEKIVKNSYDYKIVFIDHQIIDKYNILKATMMAMKQAVESLEIIPDLIRIDGNQAPKLNYPVETIIKGDDKFAEISAASILAKVARDNFMIELDKSEKSWDFAKHKGYGTKLHREHLLQNTSISYYHRRSFKPVAEILNA